jgi:hypothetical protein
VPDNSKRIAEIREILQAGATQVATDGTNVVFDLNQLRKELRQLMSEDPLYKGRRPVASSIKLG